MKTAEILFKEQQEIVENARTYGRVVRDGLGKLSQEYKQSKNYRVILDSLEVFEYRRTMPSSDAQDPT